MRSVKGINSSSFGSFASGEPVSAAGLNRLGVAIDKVTTTHSNDINFSSSAGGTAYATPQQVYDMSGAITPLFPSINGDKVTIQPGTVNRYIPKVGSDYIDKVPAPTITVNDNGYVMIKATYEPNKYFPRTAEVVFQAVSTPPADTDTTSYYPIGTITKVTTGSVVSYSMQFLTNGGNLIVNRLKAGNSIATWWWDVIS
jgi:hypothetical protein